MWSVAMNMWNKLSRTANKGWSCSLRVERGTNNSLLRKCIFVTKYSQTKPRTWADTLVGPKQRKSDMRFGAWNVRNTDYYLSIYLSIHPSVRPSVLPSIHPVIYNNCRRHPETKRHSSLFLHWPGSKFPVVMVACAPSIHVFLDVLFSFSPVVSIP
jgi:hypothetical protein